MEPPAARPTFAPTLPGVSTIPPELADLRRSIDNIDAALVHLLAERFRCTQQVGRLKARAQMSPSDPAREEQQIVRLRALAHDSGLDPVFAEKFLNFVVAEVIRHHEQIAADRLIDDGLNPPEALDGATTADDGSTR